MRPFNAIELPHMDRQRLILEISLLVFFALFLFGAKVLIISQYGNATPYWDQWDAEAANLYKPYLEGNLSWVSLLAPHNEHRIFTTRLLALGLLELNGSWNPLLQMVVNAVLHIVALCLILTLLLRVIGRQYMPMLLAFAMVLFSVPFAWENTLAGFQSQFYFVLFFGALSLWLLITADSLSLKWWSGIFVGVLSFLSLASGVFAIAAALAVMIGQYVIGVRRNFSQLSGILLLCIFIYLAFSLTPVIEGHNALKAHTASEFIKALGQVMTWPASGFWYLGVVYYLPAVIFGINMLIDRPSAMDKRWFLLGAVAWCVGQCVSLAYGRAIAPTSSRYLDLVAIGLLVNFSVMLLLLSKVESQWRYLARIFGFGWVVVLVAGLAGMYPSIGAELKTKHDLSSIQEAHVREYLCDGNNKHLQNKPHLHIPYPNAVRLQQLLDDTVIRSILPGNIYAGNSDSSVGSDGFPFCSSRQLSSAYSVRSWSGNAEDITLRVSNVQTNSWKGGDYFMNEIDGLTIIGSLVTSDSNTGYLVVRVRQGDKLLYRTGPRPSKQSILVGVGGAGEFYVDVPVFSEWSLIEFSNPSLPPEFDVAFIDAGTGWGEWSAISLKDDESPQ